MRFTIILGLLAIAVSSSSAGFLGEIRVAKYVPGGANDLEKEKYRNELLQERGQCTGVNCTYVSGSNVIECVISSCYPTEYFTQKCVSVLAATGSNPCYYEHKPEVPGAAFPYCCEAYKPYCKGGEGFEESKLPKYTAEEIEECEHTPIMVSK